MALALCMSPLLINNASGGFNSIGLLGFYGKCYRAEWGVSGGQKPGSCEIVGGFEVLTSRLVCLNPDGNDVRVGQGGLSPVFIELFTPDTEIIDSNGKSVVLQNFPWSVEEFNDPLYLDLCKYWSTDPPDGDNKACDCQVAFENFYSVSENDCVNPNWTPFAYLIRDLEVSGDIYCDGELTRSSALAYCVTDQEYTSWPISPAGSVAYTCNVNPVANNDSYSFSISKVTCLNVAAPGVLEDDTDNEGDSLTASLTVNVVEGTLVFNADGSFTYTPDSGFTGTDGFGYTANDANLASEEAWVTITVKK